MEVGEENIGEREVAERLSSRAFNPANDREMLKGCSEERQMYF